MAGGDDLHVAPRIDAESVRNLALAIGGIAWVAGIVLHYTPGRDYAWAADPIPHIGFSHGLWFFGAAAAATRWPRASAWALALGTATGPWAAVLADLNDPLHDGYLFITLAPLVMVSLILPAVAIIVVMLLDLAGLLVLQVIHPAEAGLHVIALLMVMVFGILLAVARGTWDRDRRLVITQQERLQEALATARESHDRFRALSDAAMEGVAIHRDGVLLEANQAFADMFGYKPAEIAGVTVAELVHAEDLATVREHMASPDMQRYEIRLRRRDGTWFWGEAVGRPLPYRGEKVRVVAVRDTTARHEADAARQEALRQSLEVEKMREIDALRRRFLNTASHELNTPLTPMLLQARMLRQRLEALGHNEVLDGIDMIHRNTERLALLVRDVLDVARLDGGELRLDRRRIDLAALVRDEVAGHAPVAEQEQVVLALRAEEEAWVEADPTRIGQVVSNLLSNALKFTDEGGTVEVAVSQEPAHVIVTVTDSGRGFDKAQEARLFQPFSQVHEPDPSLGGTGLGLYICRGIIEAHGGTIEAHSQGPGRGATFVVRLPVG